MATANPVAPDWASASAAADVDMSESSDLPAIPASSLFADVVRRSRMESVSSSFVSQVSDDGELFANHDRMTDFEREHYHPLNILPSRPCSAFFRPPDKELSSADIFKELQQIDNPVSAVRCLQRNPSGHAFITFSTSAYRKKFLDKSPWIPRRSNNYVLNTNHSSSDITYVTVYDAPYELPDSALQYRLRHFGAIFSSRCSKVPGLSGVQNGLRDLEWSLRKVCLPFFVLGATCFESGTCSRFLHAVNIIVLAMLLKRVLT